MYISLGIGLFSFPRAFLHERNYDSAEQFCRLQGNSECPAKLVDAENVERAATFIDGSVFDEPFRIDVVLQGGGERTMSRWNNPFIVEVKHLEMNQLSVG